MVAKLIASTAALALMSGIALAQDATKPPADAMPADAANRAKTTVESGSDAAAGGAARMQEGTETAQDSLKAGEGTAQDSSEKAPPATMADGTKGADTPMVTTAGADGAAQSGILFSQSEGETLTEEIIGADVRNAEDESIGEIKALVLDENMAVKGAIVGVGGFLGIGDKEVGVGWADLSPAEDGYIVQISKEELESAEPYRTLEQQEAAAEAQAARDMMRRQAPAAPPAPATTPDPATRPPAN